MNNTDPPKPERKRFRHILHRWKDRRRRKKASKPQSILEANSNHPPTSSNTSNRTNTALSSTTRLTPTSNPRRNTAPTDFFTARTISVPNAAPASLPSPTPTKPPPAHHCNTNATTQYVTAAQVAARVTADEESLQRIAALLRGEQALTADVAKAEREMGLARLRGEMVYKSGCQTCGRKIRVGVRCECGRVESIWR